MVLSYITNFIYIIYIIHIIYITYIILSFLLESYKNAELQFLWISD